MAPGETQPLKSLRHNPASLEFWRAQYAKLPSAPLGRFETSYPPEQLKTAFGQYQQRIFTKNSRTILTLASKLLAFHPFGTTRVQLIDQDLTLEINPSANPPGIGRAPGHQPPFKLSALPVLPRIRLGHPVRQCQLKKAAQAVLPVSPPASPWEA